MINKKMIVSDYDGTYKVKSDNCKEDIFINNESIKKFMNNKDNIFMFATGRVFSSFYKEYILNNLLFDFVSCANGNIVFNSNFDLIFSNDIKKSFLVSLKKFYYLFDSLVLKDSFGNENKKSIVELEIAYKDLLAKKTLLQFLHDNSMFSYYHDVDNPLVVHIFNSDFDKTYSIDKIAKLNNVSSNNIYTIGDGYNDLKMIQKYNGFSINNCNSDLQKSIISSFDSVAEFVDKVAKDDIKKR